MHVSLPLGIFTRKLLQRLVFYVQINEARSHGDTLRNEGAKFFRCQSDPETIRNNFFDGKTALVKLMLSKRKMAKRALERKHGKKVGSQQWRLGKLRKNR
ncbi:hypothetical protein V5799_025361 [Amblyomma americanum]|uniref:Uncharacterized protein n=1 Tax=Amblyomma americanum TaxID=6943 RepID=A0AAQ4E9K7_AMBAM